MRRVVCLLSILLLGCQPPTPRLSGTGMDMFAPVKVRLHPLTRLSPSATQPAATNPATALVVHLEFADQFNDVGKGAGDVVFQLLEAPQGLRKGMVLGEWRFALNTPESNREHWDRTTRTYLFRMPLSPGLTRDRLHVTVAVTLPGGAVLTDELMLPAR